MNLPKSMKNLIKIEARKGKVKLNDAVDPWSADDLIEELQKLYGQTAVEKAMEVGGFVAVEDDALETVHLEINSPGGSVTDGYRIFHELEAMKARGVRVEALINGRAASMATVIAMAADVRRLTKGSLMLVHDASTVTMGTAKDHRNAADSLEQMSAEIAEIYAKVTGSDAEDMRDLMAEDRWMSGPEALEIGFIDEIVTGSGEENSQMQKSCTCKKVANSDNDLNQTENMFESRKDLKAKLETAEADLTRLESELEASEAKVADATAQAQELAEVRDDFSAAKEEITAQSVKIEGLESDLEAEKAKTTDEAINALVTAKLAEAGHPGIEFTDEDDAEQSIRDQYEAITDPAVKAEFRKKHWASLINESTN